MMPWLPGFLFMYFSTSILKGRTEMIGKSCKNCFYSTLNGAPDVTRRICLECSRLSNFAPVEPEPVVHLAVPACFGDYVNCENCRLSEERLCHRCSCRNCDVMIECAGATHHAGLDVTKAPRLEDLPMCECLTPGDCGDCPEVHRNKVWSRDDVVVDGYVYGARNPLFMVDPTGKNPPVEIPTNPGMTGQYTFRGGIEPLDFIQSNRMSFLEGNVIKYLYRYPTKGGLEALKKAAFYLNQIIEGYEGE